MNIPEVLTVSGGRQDVSPPLITSIQIVPESIDIGGESSTITFYLSADDESELKWNSSRVYMIEPGNAGRNIYFNPDPIDPTKGIAELVLTESDPSGDWEIVQFDVEDVWGQRRTVAQNYVGPQDSEQKSYQELRLPEVISVGLADTDNDGIPNTQDIDDDDDGVVDTNDAFPFDGNESQDTDNDGIGNNADEDDDGDGINDFQEIADGTDPLNRNSCATCFSLDVDRNGEITALSDGLLIIRHLFGFNGDSLISGAISADSPIDDPNEISDSLTETQALDIDGDGETRPLTDGLIVIRYLFGFVGQSLTVDALSSNASRADAAAIKSYLDRFNVARFNPNKLIIATGASASIVNNVAQNGSQFTMQIINYTDFDIELTKYTQESGSEEVLLSTTDPSLLGGDMILEPNEATAITLTVGPLGETLPFTTNFYYINPETKAEEKRSYEWKVE